MEDKTDTGLHNTPPQHASGMCIMTGERATPSFQQRKEQAVCGPRPKFLQGDSGGSGNFSMNEVLEFLDNLSFRQDEQMAKLRLIHQESLAQLRDELSSWMEQHGQQLAQMLASFNFNRRRSQQSKLGSDEFSILDNGGGDEKSLGIEGDESSCARDVVAEVVTYTQSLHTEDEDGEDMSAPIQRASSMFAHMSAMPGLRAGEVTRAFVDNELSNKMRKGVRSSHGLPGAPDNAVRRFVRAQRFDHLSAFLVITNAIFIGVQVEYMFRTSDTPLPISIIDYTFCVAFACELCLRLYAYGRLVYFFGDDYAWNWFDFVIVSLSTLDTVLSTITQGEQSPLGNISVLRIVRIVRITRVLRIIRVMKFFKDLRIMIAAISSTLKTATWALLLLLVAMYMFGIAITQTAAERAQDKKKEGTPMDDDEPLLEWFGSLPKSLFTLFMSISGGIDYENAARPLFDLPMSLCIYMFFILFSSFCVMNVVTGIFCQNAIETFENDKENLIRCQLAEKARFVDTLTTMFREWDLSGDGQCTREEFEKHISDPRMQVLLRTLDIEARDAVQLFSMMDFEDRGYLDLEEFIHGCITLRGGAKAVHMERALVDNKLTNAKLDKITKYLKDLSIKVNGNVLAPCAQPFELGTGSPKAAGKSHVAAVRRAKQKETSSSSEEGQKLLDINEPVVARTPRAHFTIKEVPHSPWADRVVTKSITVETQHIEPPSPSKPKTPTQEVPIFFAPGVVPDC